MSGAVYYGGGKAVEAVKRSIPSNKSITINTSENEGDFGVLCPESILNKRQKTLLELLDKQGSTAIIRKKSVSMNDLWQLTKVTGDEFNMFTRGGRRLIIRGVGNKVTVPNEKMYNDLLNGKYGKFSGHTHPNGYSLEPGPADEPFLKSLGQRRSSIWGNDGSRDRYRTFGQDYLSTQDIRREIAREKWNKIYSNY
ncbi:MAG: hypothetical protein HFJ08_18780 [Lachnospiraceae bacterium]|nr:hypothetical protein [Lachnospiraceae bacterium]